MLNQISRLLFYENLEYIFDRTYIKDTCSWMNEHDELLTYRNIEHINILKRYV